MMRIASLLRDRPALSHAPVRALPALARAAFSSQSHLSSTRFTSLEISENSKRAIRQELKYDYLTDVQEKTFAPILAGKDVLSKAKTGNGKTMAFLLPAIERMVRHGLDSTHSSIPMLVISPTRELAQQITTEARKIGQFHNLHVACFVGGTSVHKDSQTLKGAKPIDILVATPGRLLDHIEQDTGSIKKMLRKLQFLVLDEADRLLDMGFRNEVVKILSSVPSQRQTLLFSATLPRSTQELTRLALRKDFEIIDTVSDSALQTNLQVKQEYVVCRSNEVVSVVENILSSHVAQFPNHYKIIVFFPTARAAQFMAQLFTAAGFKGVLEMHSRKSQTVRTKTADKFRSSTKVMMFSSDVSARGVDYPGVTLVVQVGLTDRDSYIHRLGRTARGGSSGHGILVLSVFEKPFLNELQGLPLSKLKVSESPVQSKESLSSKVIAGLKANSELEKSAVQSYQAWLGFYHSNLRRLGINKEQLVDIAKEYSETIGLKQVPKLDEKILKKMGMLGISGIEVADPSERRGRRITRQENGPPRSPRGEGFKHGSSPSRSDERTESDRSGGQSFASDWGDAKRSPRAGGRKRTDSFARGSSSSRSPARRHGTPSPSRRGTR